MDLIHKIESLRYDIENGVVTDVISISVRLIQIKDQTLQLQQTGVMACFSEEQLSQINKYGKHQYNRASMDLSYVSFEFWLK